MFLPPHPHLCVCRMRGCSRAIFYRPPKASVLDSCKTMLCHRPQLCSGPFYLDLHSHRDEAFRGSDVVVKFQGT